MGLLLFIGLTYENTSRNIQYFFLQFCEKKWLKLT